MPDEPAARPLVIAHRGASGLFPEHSRSAYAAAIDMGADAIEPDIVATRDGVLVLRHENEISGTTDVASRPEFRERRTVKVVDGVRARGWFTEDFTWAELRTLRTRERLPGLRPQSAAHDGADPILRLDDLIAMLDAAPREVGLVAEIKHATYFDAIGLPLGELVDDALGRLGWRDDRRLTIESFEKTVLDDLRRRGTGGRRVYLMEQRGVAADERARYGANATTYAAERRALSSLAERVDGISISVGTLMAGVDTVDPATPGVLRSGIVERAHRAGLQVFAWTLRPENRFLPAPLRRTGEIAARGDWMRWYTSVMRTGVDAVFADHPDLALAARSAVGPRS
ncbi:glycerophosphodiester phosphodiesterase family protein [Curtobacterium ammoniigenes]|uniref:glycerophosphodiester phosphodiesterase family protein n=1 Tax=Curtobacterium ammoniigenes TaxID=395387 RepID=UPI00082B9B29|nr:glycerophosphodiester phosphodiesterase family protein [Curtobacterium ammoniigenes]